MSQVSWLKKQKSPLLSTLRLAWRLSNNPSRSISLLVLSILKSLDLLQISQSQIPDFCEILSRIPTVTMQLYLRKKLQNPAPGFKVYQAMHIESGKRVESAVVTLGDVN